MQIYVNLMIVECNEYLLIFTTFFCIGLRADLLRSNRFFKLTLTGVLKCLRCELR